MSIYELKLKMLETIPNCPKCGCKMIVLDNSNPKSYSHFAIMKCDGYGDPGLICFQCKRIEDKQKNFDALPSWIRFKLNFDKSTGIITHIKRLRKRIRNFWYLKVCGNPKRIGHKKNIK